MKKAKDLPLSYLILDALADDGESIIQIEGHLKHCGLSYQRTTIITTLVDMLSEGLIYIAYPYDMNITDLSNAEDESVTDFWFELSNEGKEKQQLIEEYE